MASNVETGISNALTSANSFVADKKQKVGGGLSSARNFMNEKKGKVLGSVAAIKTLLDRLAELEDKIEDGTLIELPRNKIKIREDKDADWNSQNFPKGSGGPYDYDYKGPSLLEIYIKDSARNINPKGFESAPDGSLFASYKVDNLKLWEGLKTGLFGFSIDGLFHLDNSELDDYKEIYEILNKFKNIK